MCDLGDFNEDYNVYLGSNNGDPGRPVQPLDGDTTVSQESPNGILPEPNIWFLSNLFMPRSTPFFVSITEGYVLSTIDTMFGAYNACGSDDSILPQWMTPEIYPDSCRIHDSCYDSPDAIKNVCDQEFLHNMLDERPGMMAEAFLYFGAVRLGGEGAFEEAQNSWEHKKAR